MKTHLVPLALAIVALAATSAEAQTPWMPASPGAPAAIGPTTGFSTPAIGLDAGPAFPYSYYAAFPRPARAYVPYGPADAFPFHGRPYGRAYDRWSWTSLAGYPDSLARYFYPPVR